MKKITIAIIVSIALLFLIGFNMIYRGLSDEEIEALVLEAASIPITYIDIELDDEITASGYIWIADRTNTNNESVAVFYPYPSYFHLFPFAITSSVPRFRITNRVDELFSLLGIDRDEVPRDNYGRQRLENVTAVFDFFTKQDCIILNVIYGNITHFVDNWEVDSWELIEPDFILITNGDETIEPTLLRVGDDFMGLRLSRIKSSRIFLKNDEIYRQLSASAEVSGQLTLLGDLDIQLDFISVNMYYEGAFFTVSSEYMHILPRIADFQEVSNTFPVFNVTEMMAALGVTRQEMEIAQRIEFTDVTMTFDFTWISSASGYHVSFAALLTDQ